MKKRVNRVFILLTILLFALAIFFYFISYHANVTGNAALTGHSIITDFIAKIFGISSESSTQDFWVQADMCEATGTGKCWYVSKSVSTSGNGSSWASAWRDTTNIVWSSINPGDIVYLDGGTSGYTYSAFNTAKSGSAGNPITIKRSIESGHEGIVTLNCPININNDYIVLSGNGDYNKFIIDVKTGVSSNYPYGSLYVGGSYFALDSAYLPGDHRFGGSYFSMSLRGSTSINNSKFYRAAGEDMIDPEFVGGYLNITNSIFSDQAINPGDGSHRDLMNPWTTTGGWNFTFMNNIVYNMAGDSSGDCMLMQNTQKLGNVLVAYNVFDDVAYALRFGSGSAGANSAKVYNNVFHNGVWGGSVSSFIALSGVSSQDLKNNIAGSGSSFVNDAGTALTGLNFNNVNSVSGFDGIARTVDDGFNIGAGSSAINAGVNVGLTKDILGNPIVGNPDLGAYEYANGSVIVLNGICGISQNNCTSGTLSNVGSNSTSYTWQCLGSGGGTTASCSMLIPQSAPSISSQPSSQTATVGTTATFSLVASGNPTPSYQWQKNGTNIAGATNAIYTTSTLTLNDNNTQYRVNVSNSQGSVLSNSVTLIVTNISSSDSLIAYWAFDESSGTIAEDSSGNGHTGTLTNGPTFVTGKKGNAVSFDGSNDYVGVASSVQTPSSYTVSMWIYPRSSSGYQSLVSQDVNYALQYANSRMDFWYTPSDHYSNTAIPLNVWSHVAFVNNNGNVVFYLNGVVDGSASSTSGLAISIADIGRDSGGQYYNGYIDEIKVFNRVLSASEVLELHNGTSVVVTNGICGISQNNCTSGTLSNAGSNSTSYTWQCLGSGGGTTASCSLSKTNIAPSVNAGSTQTITLPSTVTLSGTASDDGLPSGVLTTIWSKASGPGAVTFTNANALSTTASFSMSGKYNLMLNASDGALSTTSNVVITVNAAPVNYILSIAKSGTGGGVITSSPSGINCGATCSMSTVSGTSVILTALANTTSIFTSWSGCDSTNGNICIANMNANKTITAIFTKINVAPTVSITSPISGASYTEPASLTVNATASDTDGTIARVAFVVLNSSTGKTIISQNDTNSPYSLALSNLGQGVYTINAISVDNLNAVSTTASISISVASSISIDSDGDGVQDSIDLCPNTPSGKKVNQYGCPVPKSNKFKLSVNVSSANLLMVENLQIANDYGNISYVGKTINLVDNYTNATANEELDLDSNINIVQNEIFLDGSQLPNLNTNAVLTFYGITFTSPRILKNGIDCGSDCSNVTFDPANDILTFSVSHFTLYGVIETPVTNVNTGSGGGGSSGGSGGGSGGGGSATIPAENQGSTLNESYEPFLNQTNETAGTINLGKGLNLTTILSNKGAIYAILAGIAILAIAILVLLFNRVKRNKEMKGLREAIELANK